MVKKYIKCNAKQILNWEGMKRKKRKKENVQKQYVKTFKFKFERGLRI